MLKQWRKWSEEVRPKVAPKQTTEGNETRKEEIQNSKLTTRRKKNQERRVRKQKQKGIIRAMKQEQADTTVLQYKAQIWTTKEFARAELSPDLLTRKFKKWVQECSGVRIKNQLFDKWTIRNLAVGDISGVRCVLTVDGYRYDLPKKVVFDEKDKLLSKCRLMKPRKHRFWNPNRNPNAPGRRFTSEKCSREHRREGKRIIWRFANAKEAAEDHFRMSSRSAYGIASRRRHRGELSRKDLQVRRDKEMEHFRLHAQPIEEWMKSIPNPPGGEPSAPVADPKETKETPQTNTTSTDQAESNQSQNPKDLVKESRMYRDLRKEPVIGDRKIDIRVQISRCELWTLDEVDAARSFWEALNKLLGETRGADPQIWIEEQPVLDTREWYVLFKGKKWNGEPLMEMGVYDVRFRLRGDSEIRPKSTGSPITTRSQAKKKAEEKASAPPEPEFDVSGLLRQAQAMKEAQSQANPPPPTQPSATPQQEPQPQPLSAPQTSPMVQQPEQAKADAALPREASETSTTSSPVASQSSPEQGMEASPPVDHPQVPAESPQSDPDEQNTMPPRESPDEEYQSTQAGSWLSEPTGLDERWQTIDDILCPKRKWSTQVNTTEAEQRANRAVILAIEESMRQENFVRETAEVIRLAETAATQANNANKRAVSGKEQLLGPDMTVDDLLVLIPAVCWPAVGERVFQDRLCEGEDYGPETRTTSP
jgi:hypothetical protein